MFFPTASFAIALALAVTAWACRNRRLWAAVLINTAAVFVALGAVEIRLADQAAASDGTRLEGTIVNGFTHRDDVLGYAPDADAHVTARKLNGDTVLYDVAYTTDRNGLRISAPALPDAQACILFFGDSITFGEGVADGDTFPYVVGTLTGDRYRSYNFGYSGYGPHQMLAALQSGRVATAIDCAPKYIYYLCILDHAVRVTGAYGWDRHGPRFVLRPDGTVEQQGHFDDAPVAGGPGSWIGRLMSGSRIWQKLVVQHHGVPRPDIPLLTGIVAQAARVARQRFPDSVFEVILWDGPELPTAPLEAALAARGIDVRRMTSLVPDFYQHDEDYLLSPYDRHPNARFHHALGEKIARMVTADGARRSN